MLIVLCLLRILTFDLPVVTECEGYATRSRAPMTEYNIEDIEKRFVPFDITPDMYEMTCDNEDYAEFLQTLYAGPTTDVSGEVAMQEDTQDDPEFVYCPDEADSQLRDPEELRDDRATKISKKELSELMAELLDVAGPLESDVESDCGRGKRKNKQSGPGRKKRCQSR